MNTEFYSEPQEKITYHYQNENTKKFNLKFKLPTNIDKFLLFNMLNVFLSGLLGGIAFSVGATAYLSVNNKPLGAAIFAIGMISKYTVPEDKKPDFIIFRGYGSCED